MIKLTLTLDQTNWLEATWYTETITVNDVEKQVGVDEDEQPIMETVQEETVTKAQVHCESFSGHREHIAMLRAKALEFGTELDEALISECIANFKYPTEEELAQQELEAKIAEAKTYLASTDFKMTVDYYATLTEAEQLDLTTKRQEAREYIRANDVTS